MYYLAFFVFLFYDAAFAILATEGNIGVRGGFRRPIVAAVSWQRKIKRAVRMGSHIDPGFKYKTA